MGAMFQTMDYINIFVDFVKNIENAVNYFKEVGKTGKVDAKEIPYTKRQTQSIADILKTASKTKMASLAFRQSSCKPRPQMVKRRTLPCVSHKRTHWMPRAVHCYRLKR